MQPAAGSWPRSPSARSRTALRSARSDLDREHCRRHRFPHRPAHAGGHPDRRRRRRAKWFGGWIGSIWVSNSGERTVSRINTSTNHVVQTITGGERPDGGRHWRRGRLGNERPRWHGFSYRPGVWEGLWHISRRRLASAAVAANDAGVWVANADAGTVSRVDPASAPRSPRSALAMGRAPWRSPEAHYGWATGLMGPSRASIPPLTA